MMVSPPSSRGWFEKAGLIVGMAHSQAEREQDYVTYISTLVHEIDHFRLMTGTTYGLSAYMAQVLMSYLVIVCTQRLSKYFGSDAEFRVRLPLPAWRVHAEGLTRQILDESLVSIASVDIMQQLLDSGAGMSPAATFPDFYSHVKRLYLRWVEHLVARPSALGVNRQLVLAPHEVAPEDRLGALDLLETHARLSQTVQFGSFERQVEKRRHAGLKALLSQSRTGSAAEFQSLLQAFTGRYGSALAIAGRHMHIRTSDDIAIFGMLCDLALMTPYGFAFDGAADGHSYDWWDLHPGWRFLRAARWVGESRRVWRREECPELVEAICASFGWPTPGVLVQVARDSGILEDWKPLPSAFSRAFAIRVEAPAVFGCPWCVDALPEGWREALMPPIIVLRDGARRRDDAPDQARLVYAYCTHDIARQLLTQRGLIAPLGAEWGQSNALREVTKDLLPRAFGITEGMLTPA